MCDVVSAFTRLVICMCMWTILLPFVFVLFACLVRVAQGVSWMVYNWCQGRGSILADEMGLGKTLQVTTPTTTTTFFLVQRRMTFFFLCRLPLCWFASGFINRTFTPRYILPLSPHTTLYIFLSAEAHFPLNKTKHCTVSCAHTDRGREMIH